MPYPVPFALLGDEAKGWLDTSYLGRDVRISRGNKGTTFVLVREAEEAKGARRCRTSFESYSTSSEGFFFNYTMYMY